MPVATQPFAGTFVSDQPHSSFMFAVRHMGVSSFRASFGDVAARVTGDASGLQIEGQAGVDSVSITEPAEFRDHVVQGADFFDAGSHPVIRFKSDDVQLADDGAISVSGTLSIKGISKPVVATGTYQPPVDDPYGHVRAAIELHAVLDRRDWGFGWQEPLPNGDDALGYDIDVTAHLELIREDAQAGAVD